MEWQVHGQDYKTEDGTCIRDYIHVTDLVDAHVKALKHAMPNNVGIYNVGTGKGDSTILDIFQLSSCHVVGFVFCITSKQLLPSRQRDDEQQRGCNEPL
jgi:UDP-glucose 4-epimerase